MPFKKGGFISMLPVIPCYVKHDRIGVEMQCDSSSLPELSLFIIFFAACTFTTTTIHFMPPFKPNDYLIKTHADKGKEDWEIYAWAVRKAIAKQGNF